MTDVFEPGPFVVENLHCPYCKAAPGSPCTTSTGRPARTHSGRLWPVVTAYDLGYSEGLSDVRRRS